MVGYDHPMPGGAAGGGNALRVLASGLHQLGGACETVSAEILSVADGVACCSAVSSWQSCATTVSLAAGVAGKNLVEIARRVSARGGGYRAAGGRYTRADEHNAGMLSGLVS